jgi:4-diphosphocytidyl-2-C-methyl-D-erythritol kinase
MLETAYAKLNLVLHVGRPRDDGLHPLRSLLASIDLADSVEVRPAKGPEDQVICPGVEGTNLAASALAAFRERAGAELPPLSISIAKRIPLAAGLGGGSADAAAVLRAANRLAGEPLDADHLRELGARLGSDVPAQVEARHAIVAGVGERVEPVELPPLTAVLIPDRQGLSSADVYAELDRIDGCRDELDADALRRLAAAPAEELVAGLENDLQRAALSLRPELAARLETLRGAGALGALLSGSGPTAFGLFAEPEVAHQAASGIAGSLVARLRS